MKKLLLLLVVACDGDYRQPAPDAGFEVLPLGQTCDVANLPDHVPGCAVCPPGDFMACCSARPEHFACTCFDHGDGPRYYLGYCITPKETP